MANPAVISQPNDVCTYSDISCVAGFNDRLTTCSMATISRNERTPVAAMDAPQKAIPKSPRKPRRGSAAACAFSAVTIGSTCCESCSAASGVEPGAGHARVASARSALPMLVGPTRERLWSTDHEGRAAREPARGLAPRVSA